jgi:hypothetical protein
LSRSVVLLGTILWMARQPSFRRGIWSIFCCTAVRGRTLRRCSCCAGRPCCVSPLVLPWAAGSRALTDPATDSARCCGALPSSPLF